MQFAKWGQHRVAVGLGFWLVGSLLLVWRAWPTLESLVDDAFITARYAEHLAEGYGPVYNAGRPPVEGFTNLVWVLWLAVGLFLGIDAHPLMVGSSLVCGIAAVGAAMLATRALVGRPSPWPWVTAVLVGLSPHLAIISTNGLESSLYVAAVLTALWAGLEAKGRARWGAGALLGLLGWVRPEGAVAAAAICLYDLVTRRREWRSVAAWQLTVPAAAVEAVLLVGRRVYYGAWVPNTFDAKNSGMAAQWAWNWGKYLAPDRPVWIALPVVLVLALVVPSGWGRRALAVGIALFSIGLALQVNMWMPGGRLLVLSLLLGYCAMIAAAAQLPGRWGPVFASPLVLCCLVLPWTPIQKNLRAYDGHHTVLDDNGSKRAMLHLRMHGPEGAWIATRDAGVLAYYVGTGIKVAELHDRALTQLHPEGRDVDVWAYTPETPEYLVVTVARQDAAEFRYGNDRRVFGAATTDAEYRYLGRVHQHYHRFYDVYARADLGIPPFPKDLVVNFKGPKPAADSASR